MAFEQYPALPDLSSTANVPILRVRDIHHTKHNVEHIVPLLRIFGLCGLLEACKTPEDNKDNICQLV
jgi:hypothetical protein